MSGLNPTRVHPCFICGSVLLCFAVSTGCSSSDPPARYTITGKVTFQSKPVEEGQITFEDPTAGQVNSSPLGSGGQYSVIIPAGEFKVSVSPPLVQTKGTGD